MAFPLEQLIPIPALDRATDKCVIHLTTSKTSRGITSGAHVMWHHPNDGQSCLMFGDYRPKAIASIKGTATQAALDRQHRATFTPERIATITDEVRAFYKAGAE
jgi:hypothetical protein